MSKLYTDAYGFSAAVKLAAISVAVALVACHRQAPPAAPPAPVLAVAVQADTGDADSIRYPVEAAARYANVMSFRVAGKIAERAVRLGDTVRKGQAVARLDVADAARQAASARSALDAAEHRLTFAKQQLERDTAQFAQHLIAQNALEQTQDAYSAAAAAREQSADQAVVAQNALRYHALIADHGGVITSENADTGQFVSAGQAVYGLAWSGDIDVTLDAAAGDLSRIAIGQAAAVSFPALPGRRFDARVREIAPAADPQSRTFRVKLSMMQAAPALRIGMTGDALISAAVPDRAGTPAGAPEFKVPAAAVFHQGNQPAVWVIRTQDSTLELRTVTVRSYSERFAVVTGGLTDGEKLVAAGVHTVFAGERVNPIEPLFADDGNE